MTEPTPRAAALARDSTSGLVRPIALAMDKAMEDERRRTITEAETHVLAGDFFHWLRAELERLG